MGTYGLIPAAGHGTRLGLPHGSKETQPIRGRPVIEYLIDRMELVEVDRVRVVIRPEKSDVADVVRRRGAEIIEGQPESAAASIALAAEGLDDMDIALFGFPDTIWTPAEGFVPLLDLVIAGEELALGVFESPYPERSDVVHVGQGGRVEEVDVKPVKPGSNLVWACGAARVHRLRALTTTHEIGKELHRIALGRPIAAAHLGRVIDIGTPEAFASAEYDAVFRSS
jgi:dTDP-glucose pyrophosphorylase